MKTSAISFLVSVGFWFACSAVYAQTDENAATSQMATEISNEIYSPFCPGKTLAMCPSPDAAAVRRQIQQLARDGKDKTAIKETIIAEYGEEFRLVEPPATDNFGLLGGIVIGLILAVLAVLAVSRRRGDDTETVAEQTEPETGSENSDDPYLDALRQQYRD